MPPPLSLFLMPIVEALIRLKPFLLLQGGTPIARIFW